jgi:hypothetical protein
MSEFLTRSNSADMDLLSKPQRRSAHSKVREKTGLTNLHRRGGGEALRNWGNQFKCRKELDIILSNAESNIL